MLKAIMKDEMIPHVCQINVLFFLMYFIGFASVQKFI